MRKLMDLVQEFFSLALGMEGEGKTFTGKLGNALHSD